MGGQHLGGLSPAGTVAIGIIVGLLSTSVQSVGLTLQRKSHQLEDEKEDVLIRRPPYRRRRWQLGMFMFVIANLVGSTIQITTLPLPVLSTLQASGLVFNTICASLLLHEPFNRWSFIGTALVAGGAVLIAMFGALAEPSHNLAQHIELLERRQFILWMICTFLVMAAVLVAIFFINHLHPYGQPPLMRRARGFAFGAISSILSAHSLLVAKSAVELIVRTIVDHKNQFDRWQSWIILLLLVFFALSQLYFLHRGLKLVSTSILYPFVFCIYNIVAILDGLIYFRQTSRLPPLHAVLIALGTVILLSGVVALSWRLDEEKYTAPPPEAHSLLTPGMGIVEDTTTEDEGSDSDYDIDADNSSITSADEETAIGQNTERTPLLRNGNALVRTPTAKHNKILNITKQRRQRIIGHSSSGRRRPSQAAEIWDELQDNLPSPRPPSSTGDPTSPFSLQPRRASTMGPARYKTDEPLSSSPEDANGARGYGFPNSHRRSHGHSRARARTMGPGPGPSAAVGVGGTARTTWRERDRERRRRSVWTGAPGFGGGPRRSASTPLTPNDPAASRGADRRASGTFGRPDAPSDATAPGGGGPRRVDSLSGWLVGWWNRQRGGGDAIDEHADEAADAADGSRAEGAGDGR